jgi:hypothetical protein
MITTHLNFFVVGDLNGNLDTKGLYKIKGKTRV